jgi:hypothetical protein
MQGCEPFLRGLMQQMMKSCLGYFQATTYLVRCIRSSKDACRVCSAVDDSALTFTFRHCPCYGWQEDTRVRIGFGSENAIAKYSSCGFALLKKSFNGARSVSILCLMLLLMSRNTATEIGASSKSKYRISWRFPLS